MAIYFSDSNLRTIKNNTSMNYHGRNYEYIARKIKSPLEPKFKAINRIHNLKGFIEGELYDKRRLLFKRLLRELKRKSPEQYEAVYNRL